MKINENTIKNTKVLRRLNSESNFQIKSEIPYYCQIFKKIDIFNSILIMLINNTNINKFFDSINIKTLIKDIDIKNKHCLSSLLYNLYRLVWYDKKSSDISLFKKYVDFNESFTNFNYSKDYKQFCSDINNIEIIIKFIYNKINQEFTQENEIEDNNNYQNQDNPLSKFVDEFKKNNKSIISDNFMGFCQKQIICQDCKRKSCFSNTNYQPVIEYSFFSYINFDLNEVYNYINNINNMNNMNNSDCENINLYNCFLIKNNLSCSFKTCKLCFSNTANQLISLFSLPNVLTVILSNSQNYNFILQNEINLKQFSKNAPEEGEYLLMSVLCQINYNNNNKFICYCFNQKKSVWYSYMDGKISKVDRMDINAVPFVLLYEIKKKTNTFEYKGIIQEAKIKLNIKFQNGKTSKQLYFYKNSLIINVIRQISIYFNLDVSKITLLINGKKPSNYEALSKILGNDKDILILEK